jgi:transcriptional regulator with XRE-family HTH domain
VAPPGSFGQRLKKAREDVAQLTQAQLSERSGVSQQAISKIERGDQAGSTQVTQLAVACSVDVKWLATGAGEMQPSAAGNRLEQPVAGYSMISDAALEVARAYDQLTEECREHVRRQIELLRGAQANNSGRRRAAQPDWEIKQGKVRQRARGKVKKYVR